MSALNQHEANLGGEGTRVPTRSGWLTLGAWCRLSPASRQLLMLGAASTVLAVAVFGVMIWKLRVTTLEDSRENIKTLSIAIGEQTSRLMRGADGVLQELSRHIVAHPIQTPADFKAALSGFDMFESLRDDATRLPQVRAIIVVAADGTMVNTSSDWPVPPANLSDRDYLNYFRIHDTPEAFFSMPVSNRANGGWTSHIVRRINAPSGEFLGLVLVALDLRHFQDFFGALVNRANTTVTLARRDGTILARYPDPVLTDGGFLGSPASLGTTGPATGSLAAEAAAERRMTVTRALPDYPLVVEVSISLDAALAAWNRMSAVTAIAAVVTALALGMLVRGQLKQFQRLERSERLHANRTAILEATSATLRDQADALASGRAQFAEQSETLQAALRHMNQGIIMVDAGDRVVVCNERAAAILDLPAALIASRPSFGQLTAYQESIGEFDGPVPLTRRASLAEAVAGPQRYERTRPNGTIVEVQTVAMPGGGIVRTYTDVTERRRTERQVEFLARHDGLTGLYNRTSLQERLQAMIQEAGRTGQQLAVYYIDLDGFKLVNDTLGHAAGDELLRNVASRLKDSVRETDVIARLGGDEFAVVQLFGGDGGSVASLAGRMLATVAEPYWLGDRGCMVNLSIGVSLYPDHATDAARLLTKADMALYRAKASGKGTYRVFDGDIDLEQASTYSLEKDLAQAVVLRQLRIEYQPIVDVRTRAVMRFEALLRWLHPVHGRVPPDEFIPMAERSGLIAPIGFWALETACEAAAGWPAPVAVSVNVSPLQLTRNDVVAEIEQILARTGLAAHRLNLEVTEGVLLVDTQQVQTVMQQLRALGIRFSLDDFGTAFAGLSYLRHFTFDVLKIDKAFVQDATRSEKDKAILAAIVQIGLACDLRVLAEGVETEAMMALIGTLGCAEAQGYLVGHPGPVPVMEPA